MTGEFLNLFEGWLSSHIDEARSNHLVAPLLLQSQEYSLRSGGKRFRPHLAYLVYKVFADDVHKIKSLCLALEMIHTYSLIHDDLPCMDNDDFRRGKPSNHKQFSEDIALLAGDGLLTDVFLLLSSDRNLSAEVKVHLIRLLADKIGSNGMVSGQIRDMQAGRDVSLAELVAIHTLKTANLIQASAVGAGIVAEVSESELHNISEFSYFLGMAFQIKDDLLDLGDKEQDFKSFAAVLGPEATLAELKKYSAKAAHHLALLNKPDIKDLAELIEFNLQRDA